MPRIYSYTLPLEIDVVDAFCCLQKGFTDQFVYYRKDLPIRYLGMGRCIAITALDEVDPIIQGRQSISPVLFSFKRFDETNPKPSDELFETFPSLKFMIPEIVLMETEQGRFLQVNSLGPVYEGRVRRFAKKAENAAVHTRRTIPYTVQRDDRDEWNSEVAAALKAIESGMVRKVVLSRRVMLHADEVFSSKDLLINLIDGPAKGAVFMYRYGDVFFCGCTPELLVRKAGARIESECLAGTTSAGGNEVERAQLADDLLHDDKNLREHAFVVDFIRQVIERNCYSVQIPASPDIKSLTHVQHLHTPVRACMMQGRSLADLAMQLMPTPALAGTPVGEAMMLLRQTEPFNRGFFGGCAGYLTADGDGEFSVTIRSGVFDGEMGWVYAGCGIVDGSKADDEYDEIDLKLKTILSAFDGGDR